MQPVTRVTRGEETTHWMRIGTAFDNNTGSITVHLEAFPPNLKVVLFPDEPRDVNAPAGNAPDTSGPSGEDEIPY
jgi:hypothetical protein